MHTATTYENLSCKINFNSKNAVIAAFLIALIKWDDFGYDLLSKILINGGLIEVKAWDGADTFEKISQEMLKQKEGILEIKYTSTRVETTRLITKNKRLTLL